MRKTSLLACTLVVLSAMPAARVLADPGVSEVRVGVLLHDQALFFHERKEKGEDLNLEALFDPPPWKVIKAVLSPRPHVGVSINNKGETSQLYGGLTWEWRPFRNAFIDASLGLSLHDGDLQSSRRDLESLGLRVLFRESIEVGYRFYGRHGVSFVMDHISNAGIARENRGISSMGIRYGYRF